jgi:hypothetical protein
MGRPPKGERAMTPAESQRAYRTRQRAKKAPPPAPESPLVRELTYEPTYDRAEVEQADIRAASAELVERLKAHPREAAVWLQGKLGHEAARDLAISLGVPPTELVEPTGTPTLSRQRQLLNIEHLRTAPDRVIPWLVERLAEDASPALHEVLDEVLRELAQVLGEIHQAKLAQIREVVP